jgi:uncharacterized protein YbjT (DUF2867 family)
MRVLVTGGTGTVGSQVVRTLMARDAHVSVLTRDPAKAASLPPGVRAVIGNLGAPATVRTAFNEMDAVFLLNAVSTTEAHEALLAITGMKLANVKRLVYLSVHQADEAPWLPHFGSKIAGEAAIRHSGIPFTILRPNNFFQNDYWFRDAVMKAGIYPQPIGNTGLSRVDVRDIGDAAAAALMTPDHEGQSYDLVGPDAHTGESTAAVWSRALGRTVRYGGDDLDAWEEASLQYLPDWMVFDFRMMYDHFQRQGLKGSAEAIARQTKLIGHAPRSYDAFVQETVAGWSA